MIAGNFVCSDGGSFGPNPTTTGHANQTAAANPMPHASIAPVDNPSGILLAGFWLGVLACDGDGDGDGTAAFLAFSSSLAIHSSSNSFGARKKLMTSVPRNAIIAPPTALSARSKAVIARQPLRTKSRRTALAAGAKVSHKR